MKLITGLVAEASDSERKTVYPSESGETGLLVESIILPICYGSNLEIPAQ